MFQKDEYEKRKAVMDAFEKKKATQRAANALLKEAAQAQKDADAAKAAENKARDGQAAAITGVVNALENDAPNEISTPAEDDSAADEEPLDDFSETDAAKGDAENSEGEDQGDAWGQWMSKGLLEQGRILQDIEEEEVECDDKCKIAKLKAEMEAISVR
jgi:hypothetical protein